MPEKLDKGGRRRALVALLLGLVASTSGFAVGHRLQPLSTVARRPLATTTGLVRQAQGDASPRQRAAASPPSWSSLLTHAHHTVTDVAGISGSSSSSSSSSSRRGDLMLAALLRRRGGAGVGKADPMTLLSATVGYVIIAGSMLFKVPQAARIFRKKSAEGLSASMYVLETVGIAMSLAFAVKNAFPFSTYGESVFIVLQNVAIMLGISIYGQTPKLPVLLLALLAGGAAFGYVLSPAAPMVLVSLLQSISIPLLNVSRIPQIILNHKNKSTGELAPSTLILQAAGNLARIFTTIVQVQNNLYLLSTLVAMVFNGALVVQYFMYRGNTPKSNA